MKKQKLFLLVVLILAFVLSGCSTNQRKKATESVREQQWPSSDAQIHIRRDYALGTEANAYAEEFKDITLSHAKIDDTPIYEVYHSDGKNMPILIFLHEQGNSKEELLEIALTYAQTGFYCVLIDLPGYGEHASDETIQEVESIVNATAEIDLLLDYYRFSPTADSTKFALWGVSMGGSAAYHYAAYGKKTPTLLLICSAEADFARLTDTGSIADGKEQPATWDAKTMLNYCEENNPMNQLEKLAYIPAVIVHGNEDTVINVESIRELEAKLSSYGHARFLFLEGVGHETVPYMMSYASAMLNQYLR